MIFGKYTAYILASYLGCGAVMLFFIYKIFSIRTKAKALLQNDS